LGFDDKPKTHGLLIEAFQVGNPVQTGPEKPQTEIPLKNTSGKLFEMNGPELYRLLADAVLVTHFTLVLFVVFGQLLILMGWVLDWAWTRNLSFRIAHLSVILFITIEDWLSAKCPLTILEMWLRRQAHTETYSRSFIAYWLGKIQNGFYDTPHWVFVVISTSFGMLVIIAMIGYPPRRPPGTKSAPAASLKSA
jgi:Protein of Unknown function (DUF2784)